MMNVQFESPETVTAEPNQPQQPQRQEPEAQPQTGSPRATSGAQSSPEVAKLEARLAELTGPKSLYYAKAQTDPKHPQRLAELDEISRLRDALSGYEQRAAKHGHDAQKNEDPDAELREALPEPLTEMLPNPPEGWSAPDEVAARSLGQELGVPSGLMNDALSSIAKGGASQQYDTAEQAEAAARAKFGNDYEARLEHAKLAIRTAGPEVAEMIERTGAGNNVALLEYLSDVGQEMAEAEAAINTLREDPAYRSAAHPEHRLAQAEMTRLMARRYPLKRG